MSKQQFHTVMEAVYEMKTLQEIHSEIESGSWTFQMFEKFIGIMLRKALRKARRES